MLWILTVFFVLFFVISCIIDDEICKIVSSTLGVVCLLIFCVVLANYSWTKTVSAKQIAVLEERNSEVLEQSVDIIAWCEPPKFKEKE